MTQPAPNPYVVRLEKLEALVAAQTNEIAALKRTLAAVAAAFGGGAPGGMSAASDRDLDGQYGDPDVTFIPRDYTAGDVVKKQKYSRCPADFLDILAEAYDEFAERNDREGNLDNKGKPKSGWDRKNARLARGWSRRIRAGWAPPPPPKFGGTNGAPAFGAGTTRSWGSDGSGTSNGARGFLGGAMPASPSASSSESGADPNPDAFDFGANVGQPSQAPATSTTEDDDDPPL